MTIPPTFRYRFLGPTRVHAVVLTWVDSGWTVSKILERDGHGMVTEAGRDGHGRATVSGQNRKVYCIFGKNLMSFRYSRPERTKKFSYKIISPSAFLSKNGQIM